MDKWDKRFLSIADQVATWSKDPSAQIGAIAVGYNRRILATGYNGFPAGIDDSSERLNNRETKYKFVVHAEMNCIYNATLNGVSLEGATLYVSGLPVCSECAKGIIQVGIERVVMWDKVYPQRWLDSFEVTKELFDESEIFYEFI